jgi:hypothetical protein
LCALVAGAKTIIRLAQSVGQAHICLTINYPFGDFAVASKPFHINYRIATPEGFVVLNGDQITKIVVKRTTTGWHVDFHLSDGSVYATSDVWGTKFVEETLGEANALP